ncbi:TRAP transporter substrate-binding protein [Bosea sp. (in: a-proteobacteria)]|uniref:TRAP transporter substrate-binding protein n=1 Tax=Bosea sp. (in: a-proteobacteria) TaxID=1871050 RepID=UPI004034CE39
MKPTNRRNLLTAAAGGGVAAAVSTIASPAIAQTAPTIQWRITASWPKSLDTLYGAVELLSRRVAEISDNKFKIQVFAAGEIVPGLQALDAVQSGTVECCHTSPFYYYGKDPAFAFGTDIPFGMNVRMRNAWMYHGGGLELMNEFHKSYNVMFIPAGNTNAQMGGWFRKEIKTLDDLKGLKFRIGGIAGLIMSKLGVVPQQIAAGDIYPALERGTIDAAEWVGPYDDEKLGFVRVAPYYYYPGWWEVGPTVGVFVNMQKWQTLPPAYQAMLQVASAEANQWMTSKYDALNPPALKRLVGAGAQLRSFPPEMIEACWKLSNEVLEDISSKNAVFKKIYDHFVAFRNDQYLYTQVSDLSMDSYMVRLRNLRK